MKKDEYPTKIDWFAISFRWLILVGLSLVQAARGPLPLSITILLLIAAGWNLFQTFLVLVDRRPASYPYVNIVGDIVLAILLFGFNGTLGGPLAWSGVLPLVTATLYLETRGFLSVTLINIFTHGGYAFTFASPGNAILYIATAGIVYLVLGAAITYLKYGVVELFRVRELSLDEKHRQTEKFAQERQRALYDLIAALSATLNYQHVLDTALDLSSSALAPPSAHPERLVSAVLLFSESSEDGTQLEVASARRFISTDMNIGLPGRDGLIGRAINEGEARLSTDLSDDPELRRFISLGTCRSAYCVPLRSGLDSYGVLLFSHPDSEFFTPGRREILDIVGNQVRIALQNARLYRDLEVEKERMMEIQEDARKKLARDLHDGPTQAVAALAMRVNFARRLVERDPQLSAEELFKIEELARRTTKEIRHMLFTLRPLVLETQGLVAALESMAEKMRETYNLNVNLSVDPNIVDQLEAGKQGVVFYIIEEAVNNARKHAQAESIWVRIKPFEEDLILLEVEDDGQGFDVSEVDGSYEERDSLGMVNMRERTELVNGVLHIDSEKGRGTSVQVIVPLTEESADKLRRSL